MSKQVAEPEEYVEAVEELYAEGERVPHGGVSIDAVADHVGVSSSVAWKWLNRLLEEGRIEQTWGVFENGPRQTYEPVGRGESRE